MPRPRRQIRRPLVTPLLLGVAFLLATVAPAVAQLANSAWPMFHHDLRHTGQSTHQGPQTNHVKWTFRHIFRFSSSPAIGPDGMIYLGTKKTLCGNDPADGHPVWCTKIPGTIKRSSPAIDVNGMVYIGGRDNRLHAVCTSPASCDGNPVGTIVWEYAVGDDGDVRVSPAVGPDGTIYMAGTFSGYVHAINPDGSLKWRFPIGEPVVNSSPALAPNGTLYVGLLHAFDSPGNHLWEFPSASPNHDSAPAIGADGTIYVGSSRGLYAVNPDGTQKWLFVTKGRLVTTPAIANDGTIYAGTTQSTLYALNPDMTVKWTLARTRPFRASPAIGSDGVIYAASGRSVLAIKPPDGSILWEYETSGGSIVSSPAIAADGTLIVGGGDRYLYAFGN